MMTGRSECVFNSSPHCTHQTSLVVIAAVVLVFWLRVWVAVSDRLKR